MTTPTMDSKQRALLPDAAKWWQENADKLYTYHAGAYHGVPLTVQMDIAAALQTDHPQTEHLASDLGKAYSLIGGTIWPLLVQASPHKPGEPFPDELKEQFRLIGIMQYALNETYTQGHSKPQTVGMTEKEKAWIDAYQHGQGFMKDGKHIPRESIFIEPQTVDGLDGAIDRVKRSLRPENASDATPILDSDIYLIIKAAQGHGKPSVDVEAIAHEIVELMRPYQLCDRHVNHTAATIITKHLVANGHLRGSDV